MSRLIKYLKKPQYILLHFVNSGLLNNISDKSFLKIKYRLSIGKKLNLDNPQTFNEKLQWLKLNDRKDDYIKMVDKYEVKDYVSEILGKEYVIPTIGIYNSFDEIKFDELPKQFIIKCTHDSGGLVIVKDKSQLDLKKARKKINKSLKKNYYYHSREWPYKNVKPRIIIEKYMGENLTDYKIHCFNGKAKFVLVCTNRSIKLKETFLDLDWNILPLKRPGIVSEIDIPKPTNLNLMIELAEKLSKDIKFLRVDFYEVNNKIFFGELTFYPSGGLSKFEPEEWDEKLGEYISLN